MKALSVKQPWANMIAKGEKTIELRSWATRHRGDLLICASKQPRKGLSGYALGAVKMVDCRRAIKEDEIKACTKIDINVDFAWVFEDARRILAFPVKGRLGLFDVEYEEELND